MTRDEAFKLLGGYATGTLTREEEQALMAAALEDQQLFDALAREQALHDLLSDPAARAQVLAALDNPPRTWWTHATQWMLRPAVVGMAAACLALVAGYGIWHGGGSPAPAAAPPMFADNTAMEKAPAPPPPPTPQPAPEEKSAKKVLPKRPAASPVRQNDGVSGTGGGSTAGSIAAISPVPVAPPAARPSEPPRESKPQPAVVVTAQSAPVQSAQSAEQQGAAPAAQVPLRQLATPRMGIVDNLVSGQAEASVLVAVAAFRRDSDGTLRAVDLDMVQAGDSIVLRLTPLRDGYLMVSRTGQPDQPLIPEKQVEKSQTLDLPPLTLDQPGRIDLAARIAPASLVRGGVGGRGGGGGMRRASAPGAVQTITLVFK